MIEPAKVPGSFGKCSIREVGKPLNKQMIGYKSPAPDFHASKATGTDFRVNCCAANAGNFYDLSDGPMPQVIGNNLVFKGKRTKGQWNVTVR